MRIKEQNNKSLNDILMKAFSDTGTLQKPDSFAAVSQEMASLKKEETKEEQVIKRKFKKSDVTNLLSNKKTKLDKPIGKLFSITKEEIEEKWSKKYKDSINCDNPKGFSQKAHCQGKKSENKESTGSDSSGGFLGKVAFDTSTDFVKNSFKETPKIETKEATTSSSVGAYDAPGFEDVKMKGNHPKGSGRAFKKPQIPGGGFVKVKEKCKKFPYCNQGDINAIKITKPKLNKSVKKEEIIKELSEKHKIDERLIEKLIRMELGNKK
jgi:hypothetical protein